MRELIFIESNPKAFTNIIAKLSQERGYLKFRLDDPEGILLEACATMAVNCALQIGPLVKDADVYLVWSDDGAELTQRFSTYLNMQDCVVVAPMTDEFFRKRCVFPISPPKAGTHLLVTLLEAFGFRSGHTCPTYPRPGYWHYLEFTNAHTEAPNFFIDTVRRNLHGNRDHPFGRYPSVMIYRNPLDILVSEASYYHHDGNTMFFGYLQGLSEEERLLRLIDDPWLLGSIRDRLANYVAWLDFPNVIPVSFEELIGSRGGGDDKYQQDVVWSLQLKLHVPGRPDNYGRQIFDSDSPTFNKGCLGSHRDIFSKKVWEKIRTLPQDVMQAFGYDESTIIPARSEEFRQRMPTFIKSRFEKTELLLQRDFFGYNLVKYDGKFLAKPARENIEENEIIRSHDAEMLRHLVVQRVLETNENNEN